MGGFSTCRFEKILWIFSVKSLAFSIYILYNRYVANHIDVLTIHHRDKTEFSTISTRFSTILHEHFHKIDRVFLKNLCFPV